MRKLVDTVVKTARDASVCQRCLAALTGLTGATLRGVLLDASAEVTVIVDWASCARCTETGLVVRIA